MAPQKQLPVGMLANVFLVSDLCLAVNVIVFGSSLVDNC